MKKNYFVQFFGKSMLATLVVLFCLSTSAFAQWTVYEAHVLPNAADPVFSASSGTFSADENIIVADPDVSGNHFLRMDVPGHADGPATQTQFYWRMNYASHEVVVSDLTVVMRVKGNPARDMAMDLDIHYNDIRSRVSVHNATNLARVRNGSGDDVTLSVDVTEWNTYRFAMTATETRLFINEETEPSLVFTPQSAAHANRHFRFGDGDTGNTFGADIDWIIWDVTGAYAPGQGTAIPEDLLGDDNDTPTGHWTMYDAFVLPNATVPVFSTSSGNFSADENTIINDPDVAGNKFLRMDVPGHADGPATQNSFYWRMNFANHNVVVDDLTVVMRVKGNPARDMAMDLDMHYNDIRSRVSVHNATNLARVRNGTGDDATLDVDVTEWNTYRFAMTATETRLFINEDADPALVFTPQSAAHANRHFRFGDGDSGNTFGADIDWVIWDVTGAYAPGEGAPIPTTVRTPSWDADLAELNLDGTLIEGFAPGTINYEVALPIGTTEVPVVTAVANDDDASFVVTQATDIPGTATVVVTAENGITIKTYTVDFRFISDDASLQDIAVDGESIADFDPAVLSYTIVLPFETTEEIPVITAAATDVNADVDITQPATIDGEATIVVTAEDGVATLTYTVDIVLVSIDATLSDLLADGETIPGFDPDVLEYTLLFPGETSDLPVITAVSNNENATVVITPATGIPGEATIVVTAQDGVTKLTYTVYYLSGSNDATLSDLLVDGVTIAGFDADVTEYYLVLSAGTTDIPQISAVANDENATLEITQADAIPGEATVNVTAEDGFNELLYTVHIRHISTDAHLSDLQVNGITVPDFDAEVFSYEVLVPTGSTNIPVVTAVAADELATVDIDPAVALPGETVVTVTAEDASVTQVYTVLFTMVDHNWRMYDASVLPDEHIPTFDESNVAGVGATNTLITDPDNAENNFLELITVENGDNFMWRTPLQEDTDGITMVMRVKAANDVARRVVELDLHHNGIRERLYINRESNRVRLNEAIGGGDGGEIEAPEGVDLSEWNIYRLTKVDGEIKLYLNEDPDPIAQGTSATATTQQYFRFGDGNGSHNAASVIDWIIWDETGAYAPGEGSPIPDPVRTPSGDATLSELLIDDVLIEGFDPEVTNYDVVLPDGTTDIPVISAVVNYSEAEMVVTQATELPGTATVEVTAYNGFTVITYNVTLRFASDNAYLSEILLDNQALEDFDSEIFSYDVELAQGTTEAPEVAAVTADENATVEVTQAAELPGQAIIVVTAENGVEKEYTINFTVDPTSIREMETLVVKLYPNPASSILTIEVPNATEKVEVFVYNMSGQRVMSKESGNQSITLDVSHLENGVYIIRFISGNVQGRTMFVKQ